MTLPLPAAFRAAMAPMAMVSLPQMTPLMSGWACMMVSILEKASVWLQLALWRSTIFMPGNWSMISW